MVRFLSPSCEKLCRGTSDSNRLRRLTLPRHISDASERERKRIYAKLWRSKNREHWLAYTKARRANNPEVFRAYKRAYNSKNPERVLELRKLSYLRRRQTILDKNRAWYKKNKDRVLRQKSEYERKRKAKEPGFKCQRLLRNRIIEVLKRQRAIKSLRTKELIGCDRPFLVQWIESQFTEGMTWQNHGFKGWHLDHIRPCSSFDLADREQQKQCFHYTNLQPLWAKDNQIKSDKCHFQPI